MVVLHRAVRELDGTRADVHLIAKAHVFVVVEQHDHRSNLEHRTRLVAFGQGHIVQFLIFTGLMVEAQVGQGFDKTCLHIHQDGATLFCLVDGQSIVERTLHNILQLDVKGGDDIVTILGIRVVFRVDRNPATVVDSTHQLSAVLSSEVIVVSALKTEKVALLLVGHAKHKTGQILIGMFTSDLLFDNDATFVDTTVEDDKALHLAQFRLGDVQCYLVVTVLFGLAFGEESLPLRSVTLGKQLSHLYAKRIDIISQDNRVDCLVIEKDIVERDGGCHQLPVGRKDVTTRSFQSIDTVFALLGKLHQLLIVLGLHHDDFRDDGDAKDKDEEINQIGLPKRIGFRINHGSSFFSGSTFMLIRFRGSVASFSPVPCSLLTSTDCFEASIMADFTWMYSTCKSLRCLLALTSSRFFSSAI